MIHVFVPTRGRLGRQATLERWFLDEMVACGDIEVTVVVPVCEAFAWAEIDIPEGFEVIAIPDEYRISDIRQSILTGWGGRHLVLDDDLALYVREEVGSAKLVTAELVDVETLIEDIVTLMDAGVAHGAVSAREGNNRVEEDIVYNTRAIRANFYDADIVRKLSFDYRDVIIREDFHLTLTLLKAGYRNAVIYKYAHNQAGSNTEGGCSRFRTHEMMEEQAHKLADLHPGFVKVVEKKTKSSWGGGSRVDVRISWKKAFEQGKKKRFTLRKEGDLFQ